MPGLGSIGGKSIGGTGFLNFVKVGVTYLVGLYRSTLALLGSSDKTNNLDGIYSPEIPLTGSTNVLESLEGKYHTDVALQGSIKE